MASMSTLPASEEDLRLAIQGAVRAVAEDFRRRTQAPAAVRPSPSATPDLPDPFEGQTILMVDETVPAEPPVEFSSEERRSVEEALGIAAPPAEVKPSPSPAQAPAPVPVAAAPLESSPEAPLVEVEAPTLSGHFLIFSWTALIRVLSILDLAVPAPLRKHKVLLGRIGMALTGLSAAFMVGIVLARLFRG